MNQFLTLPELTDVLYSRMLDGPRSLFPEEVLHLVEQMDEEESASMFGAVGRA